MRLYFLVICLFICGQSANAQTPDSTSTDSLLLRQNPELAALAKRGSRYLALDKSGMGGFKRMRYFTGQTISFRYSDGRRYKDRIRGITDTSFVLIVENPLNFLDEPRHFSLNKVERIYTQRPIPFVSQGTFMLPLAGGVYLLADVINSGVINPGTLYTTGILCVLGGICYRLTNLRIPINRNNRLRSFITY